MVFLRTFGGVSLENGGGRLSGAALQRRPLAILALIAAAGDRGLSREKLGSLFWPDSENPRAALKQALYALRRDLSEELTIGGSELRLNQSVIESDVSRFENELRLGEFERAIAEYHGPFLEGVQFKDLDEFDRYVRQERDRLALKYRSALEALATKCSKEGDIPGESRYWAKLAAEDPFSSRVAIAYMNALAGSGEREAAIRHGEIHAALVRDQLEAEPDPAVTSLGSELRTRQTGGVRGNGIPYPISAKAAQTVAAEGPKKDVETAYGSRFSRTGVIAILAAAATFGFALFEQQNNRMVAGAPVRLVVMPFENRTGDHNLDAIGNSGADWIADGLSRTGIIPVVDAGTAAAALRTLQNSPQKSEGLTKRIAEVVGATKVVTGSYYRRRDSLEFDARLVDAESGEIVGSIEPVTVSPDKASEGIRAVGLRTLSLLAHEIDARLSQVTMPQTSPPKFDAYREFVTGVDRWASQAPRDASPAEADAHLARDSFRRAYSLDTTFTEALVWALFTYDDLSKGDGKKLLDSLVARRNQLSPLGAREVDYFEAGRRGDMVAQIAAAKAASDLAPRSEWSWNAGSLIYPMNRPRETLRYFERLDPRTGWMRQGWEYYWYLTAQMKHMVGDLAGTRSWLAEARKRYPENVAIAAAYARALALTGSPEEVVPIVREILQSDNYLRVFYVYSILADLQRHRRTQDAESVYNAVSSWYTANRASATEPDRIDMGKILFEQHMNAEAERQFRRLLVDFPESIYKTPVTGYVAVLTAMRGDTISALRLMAALPEDNQQTYWRARLASQLGHRKEAVDLLARAFKEGFPQISLSHSIWYDFPKLQGYPPFEALVASDR